MCPGQCIRTRTVIRTELEPRAGIRMTDGRVVGRSPVGQKALKQRGWNDRHPLPLALSLWRKSKGLGLWFWLPGIPAVIQKKVFSEK